MAGFGGAALVTVEVLGPLGSLGNNSYIVRPRDSGAALVIDAPEGSEAVLEALVTAFRDLRSGRSVEGWDVERPSTVMSTAEAVAVASSLALAAAYFPGEQDVLSLLPGHLLGVARKDDPADAAKLLGYWDGPVRRRAEDGARLWRQLWELRDALTGRIHTPQSDVVLLQAGQAALAEAAP